MHRTGTVLAVLFALGTVDAHAQSADEKDVLAANEAFDKAISSRDVAAMQKLWANAAYVVVIHPSSTSPVIGWENVKKTFEAQASRYSEFNVSLTDPKAYLLSPTTAYVVGVETVEGKRTNGEAAKFSATTTNVFERHGDQWLLVLHQATPIRQP